MKTRLLFVKIRIAFIFSKTRHNFELFPEKLYLKSNVVYKWLYKGERTALEAKSLYLLSL